ncbi:MAG: ferritin [candidate division WOR-3 bacterium]
MIPKKIEEAFNDQVKYELESAYIYLSMSAWFATQGLDGMARWMSAQTQEELTHAMRFYKHIIERGGQVKLQPIAQPPLEWKSALDVFEAAYKHEQFITGRIDLLMKLSHEENDFASRSLLQWFVDEQVEEEESTSRVAQQLKLVGSDGRGVLMLDRELGQRTFVLPPELAGLYAQAPAGA